MLSDKDFKRLLQFMDRPWKGYRKVRKGVQKRIRRHMSQLDCASMDHYLALLTEQPSQRAACEACLLVTISRFFRDRQLWSCLKTSLFPTLIARFQEPIRIWSAGCAGGEEPYSIAMAWKSLPDAPMPGLLATDADPHCLERACTGIYGPSSLKEVTEAQRTHYFISLRGGRRFAVRQDRLPPIVWQHHQLTDPPPGGPFQMIFLRNNLLTYYQGATLRKAFFNVIQALSPKGCLVIGSHECLPDAGVQLARDASCPWVYHKDN